MAWTAKESHGSVDGDTSLLFVRTIEIVSGRIASTEQKLNRWDYSQLEQLTSSICHKLATIGLAQVRVYMHCIHISMYLRLSCMLSVKL